MIPDENKLLSFYPMDGESLKTYAVRIATIIPELDGQLQQHVSWWTHRQPAPCPICNYSNLARITGGIMLDIVKMLNSKKMEIECYRPDGVHSVDQFEFKTVPRHR